jgi:thioredoxin-like negative regulator of GroEL
VVALRELVPLASHTPFARNWEKPECQRREAPDQCELSLSHALRIQCAHYWLELGEADQALQELKALPSSVRSHPLAVKARIAALRAAKERHEATVQE